MGVAGLMRHEGATARRALMVVVGRCWPSLVPPRTARRRPGSAHRQIYILREGSALPGP
ncbi:hypothetical protein SNL152K_5911 [Streptomyces sp. NL15-2K]|nr:hypothetical protein SNL152K_5911 [Streptomyces sp. NL15-2K]